MTTPHATARITGDEQQLIADVLDGDPVAERLLYDRHVERVHRLAWRMSGDATQAQEYTQETFVKAFERLPQFRGESSLATWLHAICVSITLNGLRTAALRNGREAGYDEVLTMAVVTRESEPDLRERLKMAIDALPEHARLVFLMHDLEGYTHEEIGQTLGVATGTSKARLFHARRTLRLALAAFEGEWHDR